MKIGIEVQRLFRAKKHGMEIVAMEIVQQFQKMDLKNTYILFAKNDADKDCISENNNFSIDFVSNSIFPLWEQWYLVKAVNKFKPDILHCTANTAPLFCKVPMIITIHDIIYMESLSFSGSSYQNFGNLYRRFIVPRVAKKAALILTVSEFEKKVIMDKLNISDDKIRVVYNGVNKQFKKITDLIRLQDFKVKYNLPDQFLLHFANTAPKKNTIGVLKAYKLYVDAANNPLQLVLTDCSALFIENLLIEINGQALVKNITILGYVPYTSIPCLYNLATIFLYPSLRESFGLPIIEAMSCEVPVITSNTSAMPEIAGGAACLVDPYDPAQICTAIKLLLNDPAFYKNQQSDGLKNALRFNWEDAAQKIISIYKEFKKSGQ